MYILTCLGDALILGCPVAGVGYSRRTTSPCSNNGDNEMWEPCLQPKHEDKPEEQDHCSLWYHPPERDIFLEHVSGKEKWKGSVFLFQSMPSV